MFSASVKTSDFLLTLYKQSTLRSKLDLHGTHSITERNVKLPTLHNVMHHITEETTTEND